MILLLHLSLLLPQNFLHLWVMIALKLSHLKLRMKHIKGSKWDHSCLGKYYGGDADC